MPRFHFDFCQGEDHIPDTIGVELATTEDAYLEVVEAVQEMWGELLRKRSDPRRCQFEVRDANREILFIFPFQEVIDNCLDRAQPRRSADLDTAKAAATATLGRVQRANDDFLRALNSIRATLSDSRALLQVKP